MEECTELTNVEEEYVQNPKLFSLVFIVILRLLANF